MGLLLKFLGLLDLLAAGAIVFGSAEWITTRWLLMLSVYLILKGGVFVKGDPASKFDIVLGFYLLLTIPFAMPNLLNILLGLYLTLKALYSFA